MMMVSVNGGILYQEVDDYIVNKKDLQIASHLKPTEKEIDEMLFAWKIVKHVKSNAVVLVKNKQTVGIGPGQPNRITCVRIAVANADKKAEGSVLASDAFFPFPDCVQEAAQAGVKAIVQPGGSIKDKEIFDRAEELGISMFVGSGRTFRH